MAIYTVTTNSDSGVGSLRQAILSANASPGIDEIVSSANYIIAVVTPLPALTEGISFAGSGLTIGGILAIGTAPVSFNIETQVQGLSGSGAVTLNATLVIHNNSAVSFSGPISGTGSILKTDSGTLSLSGSNSYGETRITDGTLSVASDSNLGAGTVTIASGATLAVTGATTIDNAISLAGSATYDGSADQTLSGVISGSGSLTKAGAGALTLSGWNNFVGSLGVQAGSVTLTGGLALGITVDVHMGGGTLRILNGETAGALQGFGTIDIEAGQTLILHQSSRQTFSGVIEGSGDLTKLGAETLTLSGANSYGVTRVVAGTLSVASDGNLGAGTVIIADATLAVTGATTIDNAISLAGDATYDGSVAQTLSGVISGAGSLTKAGAGTLTLSGVNTYAGPTTVAAGTLLVSGEVASGVFVYSGATLGGTGKVGGLVVSGTLAPGASPGVLQTGSLNMSVGSIFAVELGGAAAGQFDQVQVTGGVSLAGNLSLNLFGGYDASSSATFVIIDNDMADSIVGTFDGLAEGDSITAGGKSFTISYIGGDGNDVTLTYTAPAPGGGGPPATNGPTEYADVLALPAEGGRLSALDGNDSVAGAAGADHIHGNQGNDTLTGAGGADTVLGGQGNDFVHGNQGDDVLYGDLGDDSLMGGQGNDFLHGNQGDDVILGDLGNDTLLGGQGVDVLQGGDGADYLSGDLGDDVLTGGAGADIFNFQGGQGRDIVTDFGPGDHIWLSAGDAADFQALTSKMTMAGADTVISLGQQTITLIGVSMSELTAQDFVFA